MGFRGTLLYGFLRWRGAARFTRGRDWFIASLIGGGIIFGGNGSVTYAEQFIPSGTVAVIVAVVPALMALMGWLSGTTSKPRLPVWIGIALATSGRGGDCSPDGRADFARGRIRRRDSPARRIDVVGGIALRSACGARHFSVPHGGDADAVRGRVHARHCFAPRGVRALRNRGRDGAFAFGDGLSGFDRLDHRLLRLSLAAAECRSDARSECTPTSTRSWQSCSAAY